MLTVEQERPGQGLRPHLDALRERVPDALQRWSVPVARLGVLSCVFSVHSWSYVVASSLRWVCAHVLSVLITQILFHPQNLMLGALECARVRMTEVLGSPIVYKRAHAFEYLLEFCIHCSPTPSQCDRRSPSMSSTSTAKRVLPLVL